MSREKGRVSLLTIGIGKLVCLFVSFLLVYLLTLFDFKHPGSIKGRRIPEVLKNHYALFKDLSNPWFSYNFILQTVYRRPCLLLACFI